MLSKLFRRSRIILASKLFKPSACLNITLLSGGMHDDYKSKACTSQLRVFQRWHNTETFQLDPPHEAETQVHDGTQGA
jgi:hypothetical protein